MMTPNLDESESKKIFATNCTHFNRSFVQCVADFLAYLTSDYPVSTTSRPAHLLRRLNLASLAQWSQGILLFPGDLLLR